MTFLSSFTTSPKTIRALGGQTCNVRKARDDEVQMKLLAGETQYEHSALSTCLGLVCVRACVSLAALQTSAAKVKFQSVWNQSIEPAVEHPCLQLSAAPGHSDALLRPAESQYSQSDAALIHSLHSQVSTHVFFSPHKRANAECFFFSLSQSKPTPAHMIYALKCTHARTHTW